MPSSRVVIDSSTEPTPTPEPQQSHVQPPPSLDSLIIGTQDQITTLSKHVPLLLPNHSPDQPYAETLQNLRSSYNYTYVINWLYNFRGYLKLHLEFFDVDIFELELLNYFPQSTYDDGFSNVSPAGSSSVLFINKLKSALIHCLLGNKHPELSFEQVIRQNFGISTPLGGVVEEVIEIKEDGDDTDQDRKQQQQEDGDHGHDEVAEVNVYEQDLPQFDYLLIEDKIEVLYIIIAYIATTYKFKDWIDRQFPNQPEFSRIDPIFITETNTSSSSNDGDQSQWLLLFDNNRLYKRTIHFPQLEIPKKRKLSPEFPNEYYPSSQFEVSKSEIKLELIAKNIFEFNNYLIKLKRNKFTTSPRHLINKLTRPKFIESIFQNEIKKRKFIANKKKEVQLAGLLAVRKRSSRLEAKQQQKLLQQQQQQQQLANQATGSRTIGGRRLRDVSNGNGESDLKMGSQSRFERRQQRQNR